MNTTQRLLRKAVISLGVLIALPPLPMADATAAQSLRTPVVTGCAADTTRHDA